MLFNIKDVKMEIPTTLSFKKGLREAKYGDVPAIRASIMAALGITSRQAYANRRDGKVGYSVDDVRCVEAAFAAYGVTDPWGE